MEPFKQNFTVVSCTTIPQTTPLVSEAVAAPLVSEAVAAPIVSEAVAAPLVSEAAADPLVSEAAAVSEAVAASLVSEDAVDPYDDYDYGNSICSFCNETMYNCREGGDHSAEMREIIRESRRKYRW